MPMSRRAILRAAGAIIGSASVAAGRSEALEPPALPQGGVNLAGAEFGKIPGTHGREYLYPPIAHFDYYRNLGFALIRLPFKWERLQPELNSPFAPGEQKLLLDTVRQGTRSGQNVIIDPHNFAKRRIAADGWTAEYLIGSAQVPLAAFADFWARLAQLFKNDARVLFGLMNEPVGIGVDDWLGCVNAAIASIRATGAENLILVPGIEYSGAHSWQRLGNTKMADVVDPLNRFAFEVHQYLDPDSSGTKPEAVSGTIGSERIAVFQAWARHHGFKAILGEFNGGRNRTSYNALADLCQEITANPDVWLGWSAWAGGPRWPDDEMFNLEPWRDGRIREQTSILAGYAKPASPNFWIAEGADVDLDFARGRFHGEGAALDRRISIFRPTEPLASLLRGDAFTLVIEIEFSGERRSDWIIAQADEAPLLRWKLSNVIEALDRLQAPVHPPGALPARLRLAVSVDHNAGHLAIATTSASSAEGQIPLPAFSTVAFTRSSDTGSIRRITAYQRRSNIDELTALCA